MAGAKVALKQKITTTQQVNSMKRFKVKKGKGELNSTGGNYLCGLLLEGHAKQSLPENFQPRRSDAISDQSVLLTMIGLLSNGRSDFNDVDLYRGGSCFRQCLRD